MSRGADYNSKGLRVVADNLDATCMLRLSKTREEDGEMKSFVDVCTGVLVKEGFILTSSRLIQTIEDVSDAEAVFFYEDPATATGTRVPPVSIPLDPSSLFYVTPTPEGSKAVSTTHLGFAVVALDRSQVRLFEPQQRPTAADADAPVPKAPLTGRGRPSTTELRKSRPPPPPTVEDAIMAFQEIIPIDIGLNDPDLNQSAPPKMRMRDSVIVVQHLQGGLKKYHTDVVKRVEDLYLEYSFDRSPATDAFSVGSPLFAENGRLVAMLSKCGGPSVMHQCVLLSPILSHLRQHIKTSRINSHKMAKRGDFSTSAEYMWTAVSLNPSPSGDKVIEGMRLTADIVQTLSNEEGDLSELDEVLVCHGHAITFDSRYTDAYVARGLVLHMQTSYPDAIRDFSMAIQLEPNEAEFFYFRGHAFYDNGDLANAISDYNNAIRLVADEPVYYLNRGNAYVDQEKFDLARKDYTSCIRLAPEDENAYFRRGNVFRHLGQITQAIADYTKVLSLVPTHAAASYQRSLCYYQLAHIDVVHAVKCDPQPEYRRQLMLFRKR